MNFYWGGHVSVKMQALRDEAGAGFLPPNIKHTQAP